MAKQDAPKSQSDKFKAMAKELECDNSEKSFQVTLGRVARPVKNTPLKK